MLEFVKRILDHYEIHDLINASEEIELRSMELERRVEEGIRLQIRLRKAYSELEEKVEDLCNELSLCREFLRQEISGRKLDELLIQDSKAYAATLAAMIREPLVVLGSDLRVVTANAAFYTNFNLSENEVVCRPFFDLNNGCWNISILRKLMEEVGQGGVDYRGIEVEREISNVGNKFMRLSVRRVKRQANGTKHSACNYSDRLTLINIEVVKMTDDRSDIDVRLIDYYLDDQDSSSEPTAVEKGQ